MKRKVEIETAPLSYILNLLNDPNMSSVVVYQMFLITILLVDGGWSDWNSWSICTKPVGGIQTRKKECTNPEPAYGGKHCDGTGAQLRACSKMSSCHDGNVQIADFLISLDENVFV